jgi:phosphonate transport system permease protein
MSATARALRHAPASRDPAWLPRVFWTTAALVLVWPLVVATEFHPGQFFDARSAAVTGAFIASFLPPETAPDFLGLVLRETWRTVAMATAGLTIAFVFAVPMTIVCVRVLSVSALGSRTGRVGRWPAVVRHVARTVLVVLRSIPELVWALIFVRVVGLGPTSGVLAIGLTYGGMLGKVYGDILESGDTHVSRTLLRNGCSRSQALWFGLLPQNAGELISYTVYRWECAVRSSVVLGFVGAGGLGQLLDGSLKAFAGGEVATMLLVFFGLVALADRVSTALRRTFA